MARCMHSKADTDGRRRVAEVRRKQDETHTGNEEIEGVKM